MAIFSPILANFRQQLSNPKIILTDYDDFFLNRENGKDEKWMFAKLIIRVKNICKKCYRNKVYI